ncbi:MAG: DUF6691 family protein [Methylococcales bacterium]|nr:DUF6691 family protein [Methylococcales bacterium]
MRHHCFTALISGLLFGSGLVISGMINPAKVLAFLDVFGAFDPDLIWVMVGAIGVLALGRRLLASHIPASPHNDVLDKPLLIGAAIFGLGWGLVGLCPGPALANLSVNGPVVAGFVLAMFAGFYSARRWRG